MICELCTAMSGRFHASRECCRIRALAQAPAHRRAAAYEQALREGGSSSAHDLKLKVMEEYARQVAHKEALAAEIGNANGKG